MKSIFYISIIVFSLTACRETKKLIITLPETEKKLAISSVVIPGNILAVSVSYSFSALLNNKDSSGNNVFNSSLYDQFLVEHALVTVSYNGRTDTLFKIAPGIYASANILQVQNETYTLQVHDTATDLRVTSQSTMLPRVSFDTLYFIKTRTSKDSSLEIHFSVDDDKAKENYYMVSYYNAAASPIYKALFNNPNKEKFISVELYSDKVVDANGKIKIDKNFIIPDINDTLIVELANISKGYYEFLSAYKKSDQLIYQVLGEPVTLPTNVIIGYGYFSTYNPSFRIVDLSRL
jgi:hypothetical protein